MAQERRPGDWQHRTHEQANTIQRDPNEKKWYEQTFWIVFFLLVFWPAGVILMWRGDWNLAVKIIVSILLVVVIYIVMQMYSTTMAYTAAG